MTLAKVVYCSVNQYTDGSKVRAPTRHRRVKR